MSGTPNQARRANEAPTREIERVLRLVQNRAALQPSFAAAWRKMARADPLAQQSWAEATLELYRVNAGPACIEAYWRLNASLSAGPSALEAGLAASEVCRFAGARAALACLQAIPDVLRLLRDDPLGPAAWWQAITRLAREAPGSVQPVAQRSEHLLAGGAAAFADFVAIGLKQTATDKRQRAQFFSDNDPVAEALLAQTVGVDNFATCERMLCAFVAGLWGGTPRLCAGPWRTPAHANRTAIASGTIVVPPVWVGVPAGQIRELYRAAVAHGQAHLAAPFAVQPIGSLRPLQVVMVGLIEDARVEALAIRRYPGLHALWSPWHTAQPRGAVTALNLMARLARALLVPAYQDPDGFIQKGRALFVAAEARWHDPAISRAIGGLLGNDLGQMRLQFNARTFAIEPSYRDDNTNLWKLPETQDSPMSLSVESARTAVNASGHGGKIDDSPAPRARDAGLDDRGAVLATYPEWDAASRVERPNWTVVRDTMPQRRPARSNLALDEAQVQAQIVRLVRGSTIGQRVRQSPQHEGEELDLDRAVKAAIARRSRETLDLRLYRDRRPRGRDLATSLILDTSQSTGVLDASHRSVLDSERVAVTALAEALEARGDRYAIRAFASAGREDVRLIRLKDFDESFGVLVRERLAGLSPRLSTRLGAAIRHAGAELAAVVTSRKLVLVMTDGEPSDIDVANKQELIEDARRAVLGLRQRGVDVFGVVMDPTDVGSAAAIFGRNHAMIVRRLADLPERLTRMYFRLSHR